MTLPYTIEELDALLRACIKYGDTFEEPFYTGNIAGREGVRTDIDYVLRMMEWVAKTDSNLLENLGFSKNDVIYFRVGYGARQMMDKGGFKKYFANKIRKQNVGTAQTSGSLNKNRMARKADPSILTPEGLILAAKKTVPSFKWAIAGAGCLALAGVVIGSVSKGGISLGTLFLVAGVILVLAIAFLALHWVSKLTPEKTSSMAAFLAWSLLLMLVLALGCVLFSSVANKPWHLRDRIEELIRQSETNSRDGEANKKLSNAAASSLPRFQMYLELKPFDSFVEGENIVVTNFVWSGTQTPPEEILLRAADAISNKLAEIWPASFDWVDLKYRGFDTNVLPGMPVRPYLEIFDLTDNTNCDPHLTVSYLTPLQASGSNGVSNFKLSTYKEGYAWFPLVSNVNCSIMLTRPGYKTGYVPSSVLINLFSEATRLNWKDELKKDRYQVAVTGLSGSPIVETKLTEIFSTRGMKLCNDEHLNQFKKFFTIHDNSVDYEVFSKLSDLTERIVPESFRTDFEDYKVDAEAVIMIGPL